MTMHQRLQVTLVLFSQSYMCCTIPENPSPEWFISFRVSFLAGSRWGRAEFCLTPDSNDWLERHHVKGVVWCKFKCQLGKSVEWSGVKSFITPSRFGAILKYETAAVVAQASGKVWCKSSGQRKGSFHWKHNGFSGRRKNWNPSSDTSGLTGAVLHIYFTNVSWKSVWAFEKWKLDPELLSLVFTFQKFCVQTSSLDII